MSTLFTETRNVRQIAMDLGADISGLDSYLTVLRAILVKLGGSYNRMDTTPVLWKRILLIKGGTLDPREHEWKTIYNICEIVGAPYDVQFTRAKLIQGLVGKLTGGGPTPPTPPTPPGPTPIPLPANWAPAAEAGSDWTSFVANGTAGFTATSDGASVAIIPADLPELDGDTVAYNFTIDTLSAGEIEFSVDESGVLDEASVDTGAVTRVTGGRRSGARALFTSTGEKVVYITSKKTAGTKKLRPKFKYNEAAGIVIIKNFLAYAGQAIDMYNGLLASFDYENTGLNLSMPDSRTNFGMQSISTNWSARDTEPKLGQGSVYASGGSVYPLSDAYSLHDSDESGLVAANCLVEEGTLEEVIFDGHECLKFTCGASSANAKQFRNRISAINDRCGYLFDIYVPSTNTYVDSIKTLYGTNGASILNSFTPTQDAWISLGCYYQNQSTPGIVCADGGVLTGADWSGDVIYVKKIKAYRGVGYVSLTTFRWVHTYPEFSYSCWFNSLDNGNRWIASQANNTDGSEREVYVMKDAAGEIVAGVQDDALAYHEVTTSGAGITAGNWHHIYISCVDGQYFKLWVDAVLIGTVDLTGVTIMSHPNTRFVNGAGNSRFAGYLDCQRTWEYAGNQVNVDAEYNGGIGTTWAEILDSRVAETPNPVTPWALFQPRPGGIFRKADNTNWIYDSSGNGHHAADGLAPGAAAVTFKTIRPDGESIYASGSYSRMDMQEIPDYTGGLSLEFYVTCDGQNNYNNLSDDATSLESARNARLGIRWDVAGQRWLLATGNAPLGGSNYYYAYFDDDNVNQGNTVVHHLVATVDVTGKLRMYRDGVELTQTATANNTGDALIPLTDSANTMRLFGDKYDAFDQYWHGVLYKWAIYEKTLSLTEINELYNHSIESVRFIQF